MTNFPGLPTLIGDGVVDETASVQAWLDAGVLPSPGQYLISSPIEVAVPNAHNSRLAPGEDGVPRLDVKPA